MITTIKNDEQDNERICPCCNVIVYYNDSDVQEYIEYDINENTFIQYQIFCPDCDQVIIW